MFGNNPANPPEWLRQQQGPGGQFPAHYRASINPPQLQNMAQSSQVMWEKSQVFYPTPLLPNAPNLVVQPRDIVIRLTNGTVNTEVPTNLQVDIPGCIYAITGTARTTDNAALPVGRTANQCFLFRVVRNVGDQLQTAACLGEAVVGTAEKPRLLGGPGYTFDRGASLRCLLTPLVANLDITINFWILEYRGPTNIQSVG